METAVGDDLLKRVIQQHTVPRETAANNDVIPVYGSVEQVADLRQQVLKVAVHR